MGDELINLQFRNSRIRGKIERLRGRADISVQRKVDSIAAEPRALTNVETAESLQITYENLRRQALALIETGAATQHDFEKML